MEQQVAMEFVIEMRAAIMDGDIKALHELLHEYHAAGLLDIVERYQPDHYREIIKILNN